MIQNKEIVTLWKFTKGDRQHLYECKCNNSETDGSDSPVDSPVVPRLIPSPSMS